MGKVEKYPRLDECKYHSIEYTNFDRWGHDSYDCYCSLSGERKECLYWYCQNQCKNGVSLTHVRG